MTILQTFVALLCVILASHQITAVVNNPKSFKVEEDASDSAKNDSKDSGSSTSGAVKAPDSAAAPSEPEATRRDAPILTDSYGAPLFTGDVGSYAPSGQGNPNLPIPVYGVPDAPSNNIVYPAPPPDIPPPLPSPPQIYGPPRPVDTYGPPPLVPPPAQYGPPHKPFIPPSFHPPKPPKLAYGPPRPQYGPPKPVFHPKPKPSYGPPKPQYGPPNKPHKPLFNPQKPLNFKGPTVSLPFKDTYGVPNLGPPPHAHYGPPEPVPHGPPHPGAPAPPTPPDIKYDGWQPIPGLVSRPPSDTYGVPHGQHHGIGDLQFNTDFTPPPIGAGHGLSLSSHSVSYSHQGVSDSYGAPLNSVTGSGGVVSTSGDSHHDDHSLSLGLSAAGINTGGQNQLSVVKSIGYELFPNSGHSGSLYSIGSTDTYTAPPLNSYSHSGPYAAAHSYKSNSFGGSSNSFNSFNSFKSQHSSHGSHGISLSSAGIGLIPPSGVYGVPPSGQYGTPLLSKPSGQYGPPKHPLVFRDPVPNGLIDSIGHQTSQNDAHSIIDTSFATNFNGPTYIPPPVQDLPKPLEEPPAPSNLYSLPSASAPISFQSLAHGSSSAGLSLSNADFSFGGAHASALTSYTAPLGAIDGSYSLPLQAGDSLHGGLGDSTAVGIDHSHPPLTIDLTSSSNNFGSSLSNYQVGYQDVGHDCASLHKSQPVPSLSYGVPAVNSYTASLSSLTTNIGGGAPALTYGVPDLHTAHSQPQASVNAIESESQGKIYGKSLAESFAPGSELIKSESLDVNNIPLKGSLGSYTLQIQSADGPGGLGPAPHAQVLNDGLLQSILAAIEQPQAAPPTFALPPPADIDGQPSITSAILVPAPVSETSTPATPADAEPSLRLIDNNEIALYFSNKAKEETDVATEASDKPEQQNNSSEVTGVRNGQQYGSYVTFKTPDGSYVYGNLAETEDEKADDTGGKTKN